MDNNQNDLAQGANKAQVSWVEKVLKENKYGDPSFGMNRYGKLVDYTVPPNEIPDGIESHFLQEINTRIPEPHEGFFLPTYEELYLKPGKFQQHKNISFNFPETNGPEITYIGGSDPDSGGRPSSLMFDETGILSRIRDLNQERAGGVEPPAFITAQEMADEIESLPRSLVLVALDPLDTGEADVFLEELKRQGEGFAVAIDRKKEFDYNLVGMAFDGTIKYVDPSFNPQTKMYADLIQMQDEIDKKLFLGTKGITFADPMNAFTLPKNPLPDLPGVGLGDSFNITMNSMPDNLPWVGIPIPEMNFGNEDVNNQL